MSERYGPLSDRELLVLLAERTEYIEKDVEQLTDDVRGNGREGLLSRTSRLEERTSRKGRVVGTTLMTALAALAGAIAAAVKGTV